MTVAVIDTGVDASHPDLSGQIIAEPYGPGDTDEPNGHGTGIASLIVGTGRGLNGHGVFGVAPKARVVSYNVDTPSSGPPLPFDAAIREAADSSAKIINISSVDHWNAASDEAYAYALSRGKLIVGAGGNLNAEPRPELPFPAAYPGVLGTGGYSNGGTVWSGAMTGPWISIAGPAEDVPAACTSPSRYCLADGTSASAALTSGVAALLWAQHPEYTANQIIRVLIDSANKPLEGPVPNDALGYGNVSARNALNWTGDPGPRDVNPLVGKRGVLPSASPAPPTSAVPSVQPAPVSGTPAAPDRAAQSDGDEGSDSLLPVVGVLVGGVVLLGLIAWVFLRSRANRRGPPGGPVPYR
ncbi:S8 family serine peptidase [Yinghuangia sp. YIM S09857]|uniref:S8 family serine peptidase n=1 Tax=Yinghuangia sp. YIM S09857 TaxID=3436929 RepID=UPI003F536D21